MNTKLQLLFMGLLAAMITHGSCQMNAGSSLSRTLSMPNIPKPISRPQQKPQRTRPSRDYWGGPSFFNSRRQNMIYPNMPSTSRSNSLSDKQLMDMIVRMNRYDMDIPPSMFLSNSLLRPAMTSMQYPARQSTQSDMSLLFPLMALGGDAFEF